LLSLATAAALRHVAGSPGPGLPRRLRPARPFSGRRAYPRQRAGCPPPGAAPGGSRVHRDPLRGSGARLYPGSIATGTPQAVPMASRYGSAIPPGSSRRPAGSGARCARPISARFEPAHLIEGRKTPVPRVLLPATPAGPAPSGSAETSRLCQGCSRPPRHHADQAALSSSDLLRQATGEGLSPPLGPTAPHGAKHSWRGPFSRAGGTRTRRNRGGSGRAEAGPGFYCWQVL